MNTRFVRLGVRALWRDFRSGELRLLIVAVSLAVAAITAVGFFADRIQAGLQRDARALVGGDAVVSSDQPTPAEILERAKSLGLQAARTVSFPTMAQAPQVLGGNAKLVALKAVEPGYPLRGQLRVALGPESAAIDTRDVPSVGSAWVEAGLLDALGVAMGDSLSLGSLSLRIERVIIAEPDRGGGFMNFAPRVMINRADLDATGLVQPASRITYRFAVASDDPKRLGAFTAWAKAQDKAGVWRGLRLDSLESGRPEMSSTIKRAERFLQLVALLAALLSAVAVAIAARGFAARHLDQCAMLRVLGVSQREMTWSYAAEFVVAGVLAAALGVLLGFAVHFGFVMLLAGLVDTALPAPSVWPVVLGLGVGLALLVAFGLPPVLQLAQVPPLRVIRRDVGTPKAASLAAWLFGLAGFASLLLVTSQDMTLGAIAVGGFAAAALLFALLGWTSIAVLRRSVNEATAPRWMILATRQICARPAYAVVQVSALALGLMALTLLVLLRTDLISNWQRATPPDAPNRFVINILPEQGEAFVAKLRSVGVQNFDYFPMIRGRLVEWNGQPVLAERFTGDRAKRLVEREFNLSYAAQLPGHNQVVAGQWTAEQANALSVEEGLAQDLGLKLGDVLSFEMAGVKVSGVIKSLRKVDWGGMRANFFVMFTVSALPQAPTTYMSAFKAPVVKGFDSALVRQFPNVTSVDMSQTITQVQRVLNQVIRTVEFLFAFTLFAGLVVLFAAVTATREERTREFGILRALGAGSGLLAQVQRAELAGVGLLAGTLAGAVALVVAWALAAFVFNFTWQAAWWVIPASGVAGAALALAAGWWGLREVLRTPVVATLRRVAE